MNTRWGCFTLHARTRFSSMSMCAGGKPEDFAARRNAPLEIAFGISAAVGGRFLRLIRAPIRMRAQLRNDGDEGDDDARRGSSGPSEEL